MKRAHLPTAEAALKELRPYCDEVVRSLDRGYQAATEKFQNDARPPCSKTFAGAIRSHVIGELQPRWTGVDGPELRVLDNDGIEIRIGRYLMKVRLFVDGEIPKFPMSRPGRDFFRQMTLGDALVAAAHGPGGVTTEMIEMLAPVNLVIAWDINRKKRILQSWLVCPDRSWDLASVAWAEELDLIFVVDPVVHEPATVTDEDDDLSFLELNDGPASADGEDDTNEETRTRA